MRTHRAAASAYATFGTICAMIAVLWMLAVWRVGAPWKPVFVPLAGFGLVATWLARFRVRVDEETLEISQPFRRSRRLARHDVLSIEFAEVTGRFESPMTLCIRTSEGGELRLNAKVFTHGAIHDVLAFGRPTSKAA